MNIFQQIFLGTGRKHLILIQEVLFHGRQIIILHQSHVDDLVIFQEIVDCYVEEVGKGCQFLMRWLSVLRLIPGYR